MKDFYKDIIHLPRRISPVHAPMPRNLRAAQFAPFAALAGYGEVIRECGRLTEERKELSEEFAEELRRKLNTLARQIPERPSLQITWFEPDKKKAGGAYRGTAGRLKNLDLRRRRLELDDGTSIPIDDIVEIETP